MIVDASVATKWLIHEENSDKAVDLLDRDIDFVAPSIIKLEVVSVFARLLRMGNISLQQAQRLWRDWEDSITEERVIRLHPIEPMLERAVDIAFQLRHQVADCLYLALAEKLAQPLVTADLKLAEKAHILNLEIHTLD